MALKIDVEGGNFEMVSTVEQGIGAPMSSTTRRQARDISWSSVNFVVGGKTNVLTDCWGRVKAGQVCAIMGPSGAGKSSLLNVLAGRSTSAPGIVVEGKVSEILYRIMQRFYNISRACRSRWDSTTSIL